MFSGARYAIISKVCSRLKSAPTLANAPTSPRDPLSMWVSASAASATCRASLTERMSCNALIENSPIEVGTGPSRNTTAGSVDRLLRSLVRSTTKTTIFFASGSCSSSSMKWSERAPFPRVFQGMLGLSLTNQGKSIGLNPLDTSSWKRSAAVYVVHPPSLESVSSIPM